MTNINFEGRDFGCWRGAETIDQRDEMGLYEDYCRSGVAYGTVTK